MDEILKKVSTLKVSARANRDFEEFDEALADLNQAKDLLLSELPKVESQKEKYRAYISELSDCYGMMGGIYRRMGNLYKAIEMYDNGAKFEKDESYGVENSYNLVNSMIVRILINPNSLDDQINGIQDTIKTIKKQVKGNRKDQWWAWADLGQLSILIGNEEDARQAYVKFKDLGARAQNFESSIDVLKELKNIVVPSERPIKKSIEKMIEFLEKSQPIR